MFFLVLSRCTVKLSNCRDKDFLKTHLGFKLMWVSTDFLSTENHSLRTPFTLWPLLLHCAHLRTAQLWNHSAFLYSSLSAVGELNTKSCCLLLKLGNRPLSFLMLSGNHTASSFSSLGFAWLFHKFAIQTSALSPLYLSR